MECSPQPGQEQPRFREPMLSCSPAEPCVHERGAGCCWSLSPSSLQHWQPPQPLAGLAWPCPVWSQWGVGRPGALMSSAAGQPLLCAKQPPPWPG